MDELDTERVGVPVDEADAVADAAVAASVADPWATFDRWSGWFCLALAVLAGIVVLAAIGPMSTDVHPFLLVVTLAMVVAEAVLLYGVSAGLGRGRTWARPAAMWVLWVAVVTGVGGALLDLTDSKVTIPLGAILAAYILARAPKPLPAIAPADARRATQVGVALLLLTVMPAALGFAATNAASPLVAKADDLVLTMEVTCGGDGTAMPERIDARLSWTWRSRDAFPGRPDTVGVGWPTEGDRVSGFVLDNGTESGPTLVLGGDGLSMGAVDAALANGDAWTWSVGEGGQTAQGGWVAVTLVPRADPRAQPADGSVRLDGVYAHLDRWIVRAGGRCGWGAEATAP